MDMEILHIIALKDNRIYDLEKRNEELMLDIKYLEQRNIGLTMALGRSDTQIIKIKQILNTPYDKII